MAKILFFSPHSFIWQHSFPEAVLAESLIKSGHKIVYITCGEILNSSCVCLSMAGVGPKSSDAIRKKICQKCQMRGNFIRNEFKLPGYSLEEENDEKKQSKINSIISKTTQKNFTRIKLENIKIGRIVAYELLLNYKKLSTTFSNDEWEEYLSILKSSLKAFFALKKVFKKEKPDYVISYNSLYSVNAVCRLMAKKRKIPAYFMHAGNNLSNRLSTIKIGRESTLHNIDEIKKRWTEVKNIPCNKRMLSEVTDHFLELFKGRNIFAYSSPKSKEGVNIYKYFGIKSKQKILVATMSSYDERFAAEFVGASKVPKNLLFPSQEAWIDSLIQWIKSKPNYFLIIRVHPREFPNKREPVKSEHAILLQNKLNNLPKNIKVNWPEDNLSLYDLACEANVFLNAWSSVGQEMCLLGLPVVVYSKELISYPVDLNYCGETKYKYFSQIERAIKDGWKFERVRKSFRWYSLIFGRTEIRIGDNVNNRDQYRGRLYQIIIAGINKIFPLLEEKITSHNRYRELEKAEVIDRMFSLGADIPFDVDNIDRIPIPSFDEESMYIKEELSRLANVLWGKIEVKSDNKYGKLHENFKSAIIEIKK